MIAERLRKAVLQAAIQGKLTQQLPEDGDAADLLSDIRKEKARLVREGKLKKQKPLPVITEDEIPFDIPENWEWVRFGDIVQYCMGKTPSRHDPSYWGSGTPWVSIADMSRNPEITSTKENVTNKAITGVFKNMVSPAGTLIMSFKLTVGRVSFLGIDAVHNEAIISIFPYVEKNALLNYLFMILPTVTTWGDTKDAIKGKTLNSTSINNLLIPLPPVLEQERIFYELNKILSLIEALGEEEQKLKSIQKEFPSQLKNAILQHAMEGKLTQQLPEDGTAADLLSDIRKEKARLVREGKLKKQKPLPAITEDEIPFDIPENWEWVRFGDIVQYCMGKTPSRHDPSYWGSGTPWVSIVDMSRNPEITSTKENVTNKAITGVFKNMVSPAGTLIMSFKLTVGRVSFLGIDAVHNEAIISIFPYVEKNALLNYLFMILPTVTTWGDTKDAIKGKTLNSTSINNLLIPLPPVLEQHRIVQRLAELLPLCESLE